VGRKTDAMGDRRNQDMANTLAWPRLWDAGFTCPPAERQQTERERLAEYLDRQGIPHNLNEKAEKDGRAPRARPRLTSRRA
jgi:hypothetical protein